MTDRFYEARLEPRSGLTIFSIPEKKVIGFSCTALTKQESELLHCGSSRENKPRQNENISIAIVLRQIPRLCKSGEFCGLLNGAMLT